MQRTYSLARYEAVLARIRERIPGVAVSTDIIVGFPGETEADFLMTHEYMRRARFDSAFLFKYSARPDTRSYRMPETVDEEEKGRRLQALIDQQHQVSGEINDGWIGRDVEVLVDGPSWRGAGAERQLHEKFRDLPPQLHGKSREFKTVVWPDDGAAAGTLRRVRIVGATPVTLLGEPVEAPSAEPLVSIAG
jgi:tRNA-2-methylthio-N6-dimethylallyladenosine synthase